jgi:hypothetical protein
VAAPPVSAASYPFGAAGVEDSDGVGLGGQLADVVFAGPPEGRGLVVSSQVPAGDLAAEDQGDDATVHVLVDAGELVGLDVEAGFLAGLAAHAILY